MFELSPQNAHIGGLGLRCFQLGFCERDIFVRSDAGLKTHLRQIECLLESYHGGIQQVLLRIKRSKLVVIKCEFCLNTESNILEISRGCLGLGGTYLHRVPDARPKIWFP